MKYQIVVLYPPTVIEKKNWRHIAPYVIFLQCRAIPVLISALLTSTELSQLLVTVIIYTVYI
jgi:hypothetical protein